MLKDQRSLQSYTEKYFFGTCSWFNDWVWEKVVSHNLSMLGKSKPLLDAPFIPNPDNLTCDQLIWILFNLPQYCYMHIPETVIYLLFFLCLCCCFKFKSCVYFLNTTQMVSKDTENVYCIKVQTSFKKKRFLFLVNYQLFSKRIL